MAFAPALALAKKLMRSGADALVIEGMEAGGHIGLDETGSGYASLAHLLAVLPAGCSRVYWRRNADAEAYGLILEKSRLDARWAQPRLDIIPSPLSRNFDPNDPDFGENEVQVIERWCKRSGIPYLGRADIGHDIDNKIVPFGRPPVA